jgi:hypothetical protein
MGHHLDSLAQVVASAFPLDDMLVYLARSDVVFARQGDVEVAFVVSKIKVGFSTVVKDKYFTVPCPD